MKREIYFYRRNYIGFTSKDLLPIYNFRKNVQGWSFIRVWSLYWFNYAISFIITKRSYLNEDIVVAHEKNVKQYMLLQPDSKLMD